MAWNAIDTQEQLDHDYALSLMAAEVEELDAVEVPDPNPHTFIIPVKANYHATMVTLDCIYNFVTNVVRAEGIPPLKLRGSEEIIVWTVYKIIERELATNGVFLNLRSWKDVRTELARNGYQPDETNHFKSYLEYRYINDLLVDVARVNVHQDPTLSPAQKLEQQYRVSQQLGVSMFDTDHDLIAEELDSKSINFAQIQNCCWETIEYCRRFLRELKQLGGVYDPAARLLPTKQYKVTCTFNQMLSLRQALLRAVVMIDTAPQGLLPVG